jgi:putative tricarboxylic transport membrane protein
MFALVTVGCVLFARMMLIRAHFLYPFVLVFCVVGAFAMNNRGFDVWVMLAFGAIGFGLELAKVPLAPFVIGLVLAPVAETELRSGLMATGGDIAPLFLRPISGTFLAVAALALIWPFARAAWRRRRNVSWTSSLPPSPP